MIGDFPQGLSQYKEPFFIDNNSFPLLFNFYSWRGRAKRKRGTTLLARLQRQFSSSFNTPSSFVLDGSGIGNLITGFSIPQATANIVPGSLNLTINAVSYNDLAEDGTLSPNGTINYATGRLDIPAQAGQTVTGLFSYYPDLVAMGLRDFVSSDPEYPTLLAFDTVYSYQIMEVAGTNTFYTTNFYKNPATLSIYPGYPPKTTQTAFTWTGQDYQQFWSVNYTGALWATNNKPGMQLQALNSVSWVDAHTLTLVILNSPAIKGDFLWINEITGATANGTKSVNNMAGYATNVVEAPAGTFTVTFFSPNANFINEAYTGGIVQYLTNTVPNKGDGIRWYDGDPTNATGLPSGSSMGWVNFAPPLGLGSVQINNLNSGTNPYYLVGARMIAAFKDRLLFFSPWIQTSAGSIAGTPAINLIDTVIWSWNGTPYYTASYDGNVNPALAQYLPILTAGTSVGGSTVQQGAGPLAWYTNVTGYGGFKSAGIEQNIVSVNNNEDVLIVGFTNRQTRFVYTGNDLDPFLFYTVNSEFGVSSTFSTITMDKGAIALGTKGIFLTTQTESQRIDLPIPDLIFELGRQNNADQRVNSARDFQREWIYFSYVPNTASAIYPTQTFFYNYRDQTWAVFYENFTCRGLHRSLVGGEYTWLTIPWTWENWNEPWNAGTTTPLNPNVIAGNPQGYVLNVGEGTEEAVSGYIYSIASQAGGKQTRIVSYNHCVDANNPYTGTGDYLLLSGLLGANASALNGKVGQVSNVVDANTFDIDLPFPSGAADYAGNGQFARLSQPVLQTKQFPSFWNEGFKTRLGVQRYLFDTTTNASVTINIYLSQDENNAWNAGPIVPSSKSINNSLIYSDILYTCPEASNLGLTEFTESLNNPDPIASYQKQIWHRINTSLIGDTFQLGIFLSDSQMRDPNIAQAEITFHSAIIDINRGGMLA